VRRFLRAVGESGNDGHPALDELIARINPLVERTVNLKLRDNWWQQHRRDAIQETMAKLCDPKRLGAWLESPRHSWFCHWAVVVASRCAIDVFRRHFRSREVVGAPVDLADKPANPTITVDVREQAARLREAINVTLMEFELDWRLVFYMRFSYLDPCISAIARAADISDEAVFFRLRKMKKCIAGRCAQLLSAEVSKIALVGTGHPAEGFERLDKTQRDKLNSDANGLLSARPFKEQLAFYMKYSPLAPDLDSIADQVGEDREAVYDWLVQIETQIKRLHRSEPG